MVDIPKNRQDWRIVKQGDPHRALALEDIPLPTLDQDEVLVKVKAAALNPVFVLSKLAE